jgi:hypothetical protein
MNASTSAHGQSDMLDNVQRQILKRTWGRVSQLQVERATDRIVIHGLTTSFYVKQLVLQAALEALDNMPGMPVALDIKVDVQQKRAPAALPG